MSADASGHNRTPATPPPLRPWASLTFTPYRILWISLLLSSLGFQTSRMVNLWQVYEISGSALQLGLTGLFQALPLFVFGIFGGTVADSFNRKFLLMLSQASVLLFTLLLAILTLLDTVQVWHIYAVTAAITVVNIVDRPARMSLIPGLVPGSHLLNAVTLHTTVMQLAMLIGPTLGGLALAWIGIGNTYLIIAALFVPVVGLLAMLRSPELPRDTKARVDFRSAWEGVLFVKRQHLVLALIVLDTTATLFGAYRALLPIYASDILKVGEIGLGPLTSAPALGALVSTTLLLTRSSIQRFGVIVLAATLMYAVTLIGFGVSAWFPLSLLLVGMLGFWDSLGMSVRQATLQMVTPDHLRGRATSILQIFTGGAPSLGFVVAGVLASTFNPPAALVMGGAFTISVVLSIWLFWRPLRDYKR